MVVVDRNWRRRSGEIDIVAREGGVLVVCEVKTRTGTAYEHPCAAVDEAKVRRLAHLAELWQLAHPAERPPSGEVRIDLVTVTLNQAGPPTVEHVRGIS
jgi:putative endonuclease